MASTGTQTRTRTQPGGSDRIIGAIIEADGIVIWEMRSMSFCSVFVSNEDSPKLAALGWEDTIPGAVASFYVPEDKRWVVQSLRHVFGTNKTIFTQELD